MPTKWSYYYFATNRRPVTLGVDFSWIIGTKVQRRRARFTDILSRASKTLYISRYFDSVAVRISGGSEERR